MPHGVKYFVSWRNLLLEVHLLPLQQHLSPLLLADRGKMGQDFFFFNIFTCMQHQLTPVLSFIQIHFPFNRCLLLLLMIMKSSIKSKIAKLRAGDHKRALQK